MHGGFGAYINAAGRLIDDQHLRQRGQAARQKDFLLISAREIADFLIGPAGFDLKTPTILVGELAAERLAEEAEPGALPQVSAKNVLLDALVEQARATTVGGISFRLDDPKTVQAQARQLAMADARGKADALTSAAGVSIKGVASIAETTTQTNPTYSAGAVDAAKSASDSTPIQTGTTDIVVQVTVSYLIG